MQQRTQVDAFREEFGELDSWPSVNTDLLECSVEGMDASEIAQSTVRPVQA